MILWKTSVSNLQFSGYAISLAGLIYYKLGADQLKASFETAKMNWTTFNAKHPIIKTIIAVFSVVIIIFILMGVLMPKFAPDYDPRFFLLSGAASVGLVI
jgi:hypothetical protein